MFRGNVTSGINFRSGFIFVCVVIVFVFFVAAINYQLVRNAMLEELRNQINEELTLSEKILDSEGDDALNGIKFLNQPSNLISTHLFGLFDKDGTRKSGNLKSPPEVVGWHEETFTGLYPDLNGPFLILTTMRSDGDILSIGRSLLPSRTVLGLITWLIMATVLVAALARMAASYVISRTTYNKMARMTNALEQVADGDLRARIPVGEGTEQLDVASRLMNAQLDRLEAVVLTNKNTIQAIAHDLRSPLSRVSLLLQEAIGLKETEIADAKILKASEEIAALTETFDTTLRISKIRAEKGHDKFQTIRVSDLLKEMAEIFAPVVEDKGGKLIVKLDGLADARLNCDERMIKQMLVNLIENATNHCPTGTIIMLVGRKRSNGEVILEVADNGPGIPVEQRMTVLEPFERLDRSRSTPGTGLGLALVAAIADRHGALIELDDNNSGLIVRIVFPIIKN